MLQRTISDPGLASQDALQPVAENALQPFPADPAAPASRPLRRAPAPRRLRDRMRLLPNAEPVLIKKYGNRRLYDTRASRYITLEELEAVIRGGDDVRVIDAKTFDDLTQATLAQIILEGRRAARLLPVPLLLQLIRMGDEALAEFMGRYLSATLEMYLEAKRGAQSLSPYLPMATMPFSAANALARMWLGAGQLIAPDANKGAVPAAPAAEPAPAEPDSTGLEVAALRRELDALKASLGTPPRRR